MRVLISGAVGFIGHHLVNYILNNTNWEVVSLDRVDEAGNMNRLGELESWNKAVKEGRATFVWHDLRSGINDSVAKQIGKVDYILHLAAASHVDRSIVDPMGYVMDNVVGTCNILEFARKAKPTKFMYFSTDEVFGSTTGKKFKEWDRYNSGSPYSATKAGGEELALAYHNTYKVPVIISHCMNVFGIRQHPEKFIPKVIGRLLRGRTIQIHTDKTGTKSTSRGYVHVDTVSEAVLFILKKGKIGDKYNISDTREVSSYNMAQGIAMLMDKELEVDFIKAQDVRPGNDFAYGIDGSKLRRMGFKPKVNFEQKLTEVVDWYMENKKWL